jgi:hypothetical protein
MTLEQSLKEIRKELDELERRIARDMAKLERESV